MINFDTSNLQGMCDNSNNSNKFFVTLGEIKLFYFLAEDKQFLLPTASKIKQLDFCSCDEKYRMHLGSKVLFQPREKNPTAFSSREKNSFYSHTVNTVV